MIYDIFNIVMIVLMIVSVIVICEDHKTGERLVDEAMARAMTRTELDAPVTWDIGTNLT